VFTRVLFSVDVVCAVTLSPVTLGLSAASQLNVEAIFAVSGIFTAWPLQTEADDALVMDGFCLTTIVIVVEAVQPLGLVAVTPYVVVTVGSTTTIALFTPLLQ
jgi:hypothetical protein